MHVDVPRLEYDKLSESRLAESSAKMHERIGVGRQRQSERFSNTGS